MTREELEEIEQITDVYYDIQIDNDNLLSMVRELVKKYRELEEKYEHYKEVVSDNYRPLTDREVFGEYDN